MAAAVLLCTESCSRSRLVGDYLALADYWAMCVPSLPLRRRKETICMLRPAFGSGKGSSEACTQLSHVLCGAWTVFSLVALQWKGLAARKPAQQDCWECQRAAVQTRREEDGICMRGQQCTWQALCRHCLHHFGCSADDGTSPRAGRYNPFHVQEACSAVPNNSSFDMMWYELSAPRMEIPGWLFKFGVSLLLMGKERRNICSSNIYIYTGRSSGHKSCAQL